MNSSSWHERGLGPLIVVDGIGRANSGVQQLPLRGTPLEIRSLDNEVKRLHAYIDVLSRHRENEQTSREEAHQAEVSRLKVEHENVLTLRRQEFADSIAKLRNENDRLMARIELVEPSEKKLQAYETEVEQLRRKVQDQERAWAALLSSKESHWQSIVAEKDSEKEALMVKVDTLLKTVEELESTLRQTVAQKEAFEDYIQREPMRWQDSSAAGERQLRDVTARLDEQKRRNHTLELLLNDLQKDAAVRDSGVEEQVSLLRHELATEKKRNEEVVRIYCAQIEHLHQQLDSSMSKNRLLLQELQREKTPS